MCSFVFVRFVVGLKYIHNCSQHNTDSRRLDQAVATSLVVFYFYYIYSLITMPYLWYADESNKSVIYILSSKFPVIWNVRGERFLDLQAEIWVRLIVY